MAIIFGVDTEKEVTAVMVRDALLQCFYDAHCKDAELSKGEDGDDMSWEYCASIIKKNFSEGAEDFDNPTKEGLLNVIGQLKEFSKNFRNPEIIEEHAKQMLELINLLK